MDCLYLPPHHFSSLYRAFNRKIFKKRIGQFKLMKKICKQNQVNPFHDLGCADRPFEIERGLVCTTSKGSDLFSARFGKTNSCPQEDLSDKSKIIYQRLCEAHVEDVRGILESTRDEIPLSDLLSIVQCFDEDPDWIKVLLIFRWTKEQNIFQPEETDEESEEESAFSLEDEEVKAIVIEFLRSLGLSTGFSTRTTKKSTKFITHLNLILHNRYRIRFSEGEKLSTSEIQEVLLPYLEALATKHEDELINVLFYFPDPPPIWTAKMADEKCPPAAVGSSNVKSSSIVKRDGAGDRGLTFNGNFRPSITYALSLGLSLPEVQSIANKYPSFLFYSPERKIKPIVNYFLALGVTKAVMMKIFVKRPQVFGCNLEEKLKPTMLYLESIGVDRSRWPGMLERYPIIFTCERDQIQKVVNFLHSVRFSATDVRRALSRFPHLVSYSIERKFEPILVFLNRIISCRADVEALLRSSPQTLGYSIDGNMKPILRFLIETGYNETEVVSIVKSYPEILGLAVSTDVRPKWNYYVGTGWPKSEIVIYPQYFGYSLEVTIKPRFDKVSNSKQGSWTLKKLLSSSDKEFDRLLRLEMVRL